MEDSVPRTVEGAVLSIADKADSIAGMFALGLQPTGSKDPFALRRQANGIVKTIAEHKLPVQSRRNCSRMRARPIAVRRQRRSFPPTVDYSGAVKHFLRERLEFYLRDALGFNYDVVNAVLAADADDVVDAVARAQAVKRCLAHARISGHRGRLQAHAKHPEAGEGSRKSSRRHSFSALPDSADEEKRLAAYVETVRSQSGSAPAEEGISGGACRCSQRRESQWTHFSTKSW